MQAERALMSFHHILSGQKISTLHAWAGELQLQGIIKTGYPGLLLLADRAPTEQSCVAEYVRRVKRMPWQTCELRALEAVPRRDGDKSGLDGMLLVSLGRAINVADGGNRLSRRSMLADIERMRDIAPALRHADHLCAASMPRRHPERPPWGWERFYSEAMRR